MILFSLLPALLAASDIQTAFQRVRRLITSPEDDAALCRAPRHWPLLHHPFFAWPAPAGPPGRAHVRRGCAESLRPARQRGPRARRTSRRDVDGYREGCGGGPGLDREGILETPRPDGNPPWLAERWWRAGRRARQGMQMLRPVSNAPRSRLPPRRCSSGAPMEVARRLPPCTHSARLFCVDVQTPLRRRPAGGAHAGLPLRDGSRGGAGQSACSAPTAPGSVWRSPRRRAGSGAGIE